MGWATYHFNLDGNMASRYQLNTEKYSRKRSFEKQLKEKKFQMITFIGYYYFIQYY
jgi:hypothetical protein